jgi:phage terminase small subunit
MNGFNATEAAKSAGYSVRTAQKIGSENLSKPLIIKEIQKEKEKLYEKLDISREDILRDLQRIKGNTETNNPTAALKSLDLMIKMLGFNEPIRTESKITTDINIKDLLDFDEDDDE